MSTLPTHQIAAPTKAPAIAAVVVTMNRPADLNRLLTRLTTQTQALFAIVVVDNGRTDATKTVVSGFPLVHHVPSRRNLGGAGGFVLGIVQALALGAELVWIMDDDGYPETDACLAGLAREIQDGDYDMVSPLILDIDDPTRLAFYHYLKGRPVNRRDQLGSHVRFPQFAHLFNGALIRSETFERYGLPRYELFFRGDETDFMYRLNRDGARFVTLCSIAFLHPSGARDTLPIMGGRYHAIVPVSDIARHYYYRNRGTLFREFRLVRAALYDLIRYSWAFLVTRRGDWSGFRQWARAVHKGWSRDFEKPP
jgi:rhamnopyranosyl-N-acetylglucosaminyl-diphospho-decaprenol beta-1,3/1,4-galactofuranosyltransferase